MSQRVTQEQSQGLPKLVAPAPEWAPEVDARLTRVGMRIFIGADVFCFAAFFFAFFYLRALNNDSAWLPPGTTHPTRAIGAFIVLLLMLCAAFYVLGARAVAKTPSSARLLFGLALGAGVLCCALQLYEFRNLGFDPQLGGGFPSVFVGLKGVLLVQLVGALLWLSTHIAQAVPTGDSTARPASAVQFGNFLIFLAGVSLVAYLVLYFV
jgi:heme/copper-type cytochrome/quinol oxidase subunit 3